MGENYDHTIAITQMSSTGSTTSEKKTPSSAKKDKNGVFNKGRACIARSTDDNGKTRLHTVRCNTKPYPENTDYNKKKGVKRENLPTDQWYVTVSGDDVKTYLMFPHWDPIN